MADRILVIGGGPGGMAAALAAARAGARVELVDALPTLGGQIWRGLRAETAQGREGRLLRDLTASGAEFRLSTQILSFTEPGRAVAQGPEGMLSLRYDRLVIATGARERFLPFPGWTLPGVCGAGGLQGMAKSGMPVAGQRVLVAGTGPLLLAVAAHLRGAGAQVLGIAEQASLPVLAGFGIGLTAYPRKLLQGLGYASVLTRVPLWTSTWVEEAEGDDLLRRVALRRRGRRVALEVDLLALGLGLVPNLEVALALGCARQGGSVQVGAFQETSVQGVFACGESTGVGGVEKALAEGHVAGLAAAGDLQGAAIHARQLLRQRAFARQLEASFALRRELSSLAGPGTVVCRCEDVRLEELRGYRDGRDARLHTRCGMGPCQGRICGPATETLFGWEPNQPRQPLFPAPFRAFLTTDPGSRPDPQTSE